MARKPRIWFPGAVYHIICRGNHQNQIYRCRDDRIEYLRILKEVQKESPYYLHAYCLMSNHVHLHIETIDTSIGEVMKQINMNYAIYFNHKYNFVGHLFQGRYRAEVIESDIYNLEVSRYIHLNPVRAEIVDLPIDYEWSSYREYMGIRTDDLVTTSTVLSYFSKSDVDRSQSFYQEYVEREEEFDRGQTPIEK